MNATSHAVSKPLRNLPASFWLRRRQKRAASVLALGVVFAGSLHSAPAATTYSYTGSGSTGSASTPVTGNFSTGFSSNTSGSSISSSTYTDTLSFGGTTNYIAYDDLAQQVPAHSLSFSNSGTVTLERKGVVNSISLGGASPSVTTGTGSVAINLDLSLAATVKFDIGSSMTISGLISDGTSSFGLTKIGTGTLILTGANSYKGSTNFDGGIVNVGSAGALGANGNLIFGGGTLQYSTANHTDYSARFLPSTSNQAYNIDTNGQNVTFSVGIGSSGGTLTKSGAGTLILMGAGTYTNGTTVTGGTLSGNAGSYGSGAIAVGSGATVDYTQSATTGTAANNISGQGTATFGGVVTGSGTGGANSNGTGGTVTYTGQDSLATTVKTGAVVLNNPSSAALTGPVAIATNGTVQLGASNQIQTSAQGIAANVTLSGGTLNANGHSDGTISGTPSASPTTSAVTASMGTLTLSSSSTLDFGLNSTNSILAFANSNGIAWSGTLKIINYTGGTDALYIGNSSSGLTSTQLSQISFNGLAARQLSNGEIVAAPEPSTLLSLLIGTAALGGLAWSRRRSAQQTAVQEA